MAWSPTKSGVPVSSASLGVANVVSRLTPLTRWFGVRRTLFGYAGVRIAHSARICGGVTFVGSNATVGPDTWVGYGTTIITTGRAEVTLGAACDIAPDVLFVVGTHELGTAARRAGSGLSLPIQVGSGSWVGARSTFLGGASVGAGCIVAAGSVVTESFPDDVVIGGVPAVVIRELEPLAHPQRS